MRLLHINATEADDGWRKYFMYESGNNEMTNNDEGIRFIRLVNDGDKDNLLLKGSRVDGNTPGFAWYDLSSGAQSVPTDFVITVGDKNGDSYTVTVSPK